MDGSQKIVQTAVTRVAAGVCALVLALGLTGCDLSTPFSFITALTTPSLDEVETETVEAQLSSPTIIEDGVLTVALDTSNAPQAMTSSDGSLVGYDIDVALAIADRLGLSVKIVSSESPANVLSDGEADIYIGTESDVSLSSCTSAGSYLENATAIFADSSVTTISSVSSTTLSTAVIAVQDSSASQDALLRAGIEGTQQTYSNVNECFEALANGEVDYVACDATAGAYLARSYENIEFVGTISSTTTYTVSVLSSNSDLADAVAEALDDLEADGTLAAIHAVWYGSVPVDLSDTTLSGVTIETSDDDEEDDDDSLISGDINSLSS